MTTSPTGGGQRSTLLGANNAQNGFLGATQQGAGLQGQNRNQQGMNGQRNGNNRNQGGNRGANRGNNQQQQQFTNQGQGANSKKSIRPQLRVAFDSPRPKADVTTKNLSVRLDNFSKRSGLNGVDVVVDAGKVTLRGQVDTEESRRLAGMLVGLEPGVRSVQNDLTVTSPPPEPGE
jgi:osmotically-inducible protein OsmY